MVSGNTSQEEILCGLSAGANDYLPKPPHWDELAAKIVNYSRGGEIPLPTPNPTLGGANSISPAGLKNASDGRRGIEMVGDSEVVMIQGRSLKLTKKEFVIFKKLYHSSLLENHPLLSRENLLDEEWKKQNVTPRTVDVHIVGLRKKLKPFQIEINAKRGEGYWLKIPDFLKDG